MAIFWRNKNFGIRQHWWIQSIVNYKRNDYSNSIYQHPVLKHVQTYINMVMAMNTKSLMEFMKLSLDIHMLVGVIALVLHKNIILLL